MKRSLLEFNIIHSHGSMSPDGWTPSPPSDWVLHQLQLRQNKTTVLISLFLVITKIKSLCWILVSHLFIFYFGSVVLRIVIWVPSISPTDSLSQAEHYSLLTHVHIRWLDWVFKYTCALLYHEPSGKWYAAETHWHVPCLISEGLLDYTECLECSFLY